MTAAGCQPEPVDDPQMDGHWKNFRHPPHFSANKQSAESPSPNWGHRPKETNWRLRFRKIYPPGVEPPA
jgi:hypothetical protein